MKHLLVCTGLAVLLLSTASFPQESPEWARRHYEAPASVVYAAALKSIQLQKHEIQTKNADIRTVDFHVGITAWSWGYNMRLVVTPIDQDRSNVTTGILRSGGKVLSWGSGKKEIRKIYAGIDAELALLKANPQRVAPQVPGEAAGAPCTLDAKSDPPGADLELDGKFVGNTPIALRLKPGEYTVTIRKAGYAPWTRRITVIPDNEVRIAAELQRAD